MKSYKGSVIALSTLSGLSCLAMSGLSRTIVKKSMIILFVIAGLNNLCASEKETLNVYSEFNEFQYPKTAKFINSMKEAYPVLKNTNFYFRNYGNYLGVKYDPSILEDSTIYISTELACGIEKEIYECYLIAEWNILKTIYHNSTGFKALDLAVTSTVFMATFVTYFFYLSHLITKDKQSFYDVARERRADFSAEIQMLHIPISLILSYMASSSVDLRSSCKAECQALQMCGNPDVFIFLYKCQMPRSVLLQEIFKEKFGYELQATTSYLSGTHEQIQSHNSLT